MKGIRLLGAGDVRDIAGRIGVRPTKKLGQNFVVEQGTVRRIAAIAAPRPGDVVLEVGPGLGSLTLALLETIAGAVDVSDASDASGTADVGEAIGVSESADISESAGISGTFDANKSADIGKYLDVSRAGGEAAARLVAVEIDPVLAEALPGTIADRAPELADRATVVAADALTVAAPGAVGVMLPEPPTVLAANLPYNVAVPVVLHLLEACPSLERGVVMVQAEVADRMCAVPGSRVYGVPSAKIAWYAAAKPAGTVPRSVFWPVPNVDSKLVAFERHRRAGGAGGAGRPDEAGRGETFAVIDAAFGQRRKTLRAALAGWAGSAAEAERILRAAGIDPGARGESLDVTDFSRIALARSRT